MNKIVLNEEWLIRLGYYPRLTFIIEDKRLSSEAFKAFTCGVVQVYSNSESLFYSEISAS